MEDKLAIFGGTSIRNTFLQYGKQTIDDSDINAVVTVLKENKYLTTGPYVDSFEKEVATLTNTQYAIAVANGTAALHCAIYAADIKKNDEVIVTALSFSASANCIIYQGATPVFCDIDENTLNIDQNQIEQLITPKTRAIITVDFIGQLCNYEKIREIANRYNLILIQDAAHSFGIVNNPLADLITFSFHPVKNITTGEGGMIITNNLEYANRMKRFRSHGIDNDYKNRHLHYYDMIDIGYNYRITDIQCALGLSQLKKIDLWIERRKEIAKYYDLNLQDLNKYLVPLKVENNCAYHIYVIKLNEKLDRDFIYQALLA